MNSASLCSQAGRYKNPIPPRCLAPIDFLKISALVLTDGEGRVRPVVRVAVTPVGRSTSAGPSPIGGIHPHRNDAGGWWSILAVSFLWIHV